jgi:hypothetical protein
LPGSDGCQAQVLPGKILQMTVMAEEFGKDQPKVCFLDQILQRNKCTYFGI